MVMTRSGRRPLAVATLPPGLSAEEYLAEVYTQLETLNNKLRFSFASPEDAFLLAYPRAGGLRNMAPGTTTFDLIGGTVARGDGVSEPLSAALRPLQLDACRSGFIYVDTQATVQTSYEGRVSGQFRLDGTNRVTLQYQMIDQVVISAALPYECYAIFSTLNDPPVLVSALNASQDRYNPIYVPGNAFANIPMAPADGGEALAAAYRGLTIFTGAVGSKIFMVVNLGANSVDVNLQLQEVTGGRFIDSSVTGVATTIATGNSAIFEEGLYAQVAQFRARNTTPGQVNSLEVQYRGFSQAR